MNLCVAPARDAPSDQHCDLECSQHVRRRPTEEQRPELPGTHAGHDADTNLPLTLDKGSEPLLHEACQCGPAECQSTCGAYTNSMIPCWGVVRPTRPHAFSIAPPPRIAPATTINSWRGMRPAVPTSPRGRETGSASARETQRFGLHPLGKARVSTSTRISPSTPDSAAAGEPLIAPARHADAPAIPRRSHALHERGRPPPRCPAEGCAVRTSPSRRTR